jgi:hypothetical protein
MGNGKKKSKVYALSIPHAIEQAFKEIELFPDTVIVGEPVPKKNGWGVVTMFSVSLPSRSIKAGISSTGVRAVEPVMFSFPSNYPRKAPRVFLRTDFPRNLPHIYPGSEKDSVAPCIYDGSLDDLLHQGLGLTEILYQVQDWLIKAASNSLINNSQGWEPIRYDSVDNIIAYEHSKLRSLVTNKSECICLTCIGVDGAGDSSGSYYKLYDYDPMALHGRYVDRVTLKDEAKDNFKIGTRPLLFCWPDDEVVVTEYFPETVTNLGELLNKSKTYGTYSKFWQKIQHLWIFMGNKATTVDVVTVHCVRRPLPLINRNTKLELLAYRVRVAFNFIGVPDMKSPVDIVGHIHAVGPDLLQEMSGSSPAKMESIVQIGCGSLGSKIAMHLCKAGHGPLTLIDNKNMSEHNLARHALTKTAGNKAELLKKEIDIFKVGATAHPNSLQDFVAKNENRLFEKNNLVIDSTASINVRETLASLPSVQNNSRVFQTGLYSEGKLGFITIEGKGRNPRVDDLHAAIFDAAIDNKAVSEALIGSGDEVRRHSTGQGCGSYTMVIPDTKISMYSAAMAERARLAYQGSIQDDGEISLGFMSGMGMTLTWESSSLGKTHVVRLDNRDWELRVLASAFDSMESEVLRWPSVETGGILIGRLCLARKCAIVTRVLEAPRDSIRTHARFELGVEGLKDKIANVLKSSGLTYLGTWHSHLFGSTSSGIDEETLKKIKELRLGIPAFNLIWHNRGLTCFADYGDY